MNQPASHPQTACPRIETWYPASGANPLADGALHLWKWETGAEMTPSAADRGLLSANERERAEALGNEALCDAFILNRSTKRRILGGYLDLPPEAIRFGYGPRGKPYLEPAGGALQFNLSHSGTLSLLAVTRAGEIGVDLERVRERRHLPAIARRMFGAERAQQLETLPERERLRMFYVYWTWLEARIKTRGGGLFHPGSGEEELEYGCFLPHPGYQACVSVAGACPAIPEWRCFEYGAPGE